MSVIKKMVICYLRHYINEWMCTTSNACNSKECSY